jgi:hypothetical protein
VTKPCCHGCGIQLDAQNDSEAHIIPNALGGRLAFKGLICRVCNTKLDRAADNALVEAFGAWPTLLRLSRQRGENPPKTIGTRKGHQVRLKADGALTQTDVRYDVTPIVDGHNVQIEAGDMKTVRQLIKRAAKQFPQLDPEVAEKHARVVRAAPGDEIKLHFDFSPKAVFGGAVSAFWLFILAKTGHPIMAWDKLIECIKYMQTYGGTFRYFVDTCPGLRGPRIDIGHKIIVRSVPSTGELIGYLEIVGVLKIGGLFALGPKGIAIEHIYVYDLLQKLDRSNEFKIDSAIFDAQDWRSVALGPTDSAALKAHFKKALNPLVDFYRRNAETHSAD